jgi:DNA polymerase III alpha subunit
MIEIEECRSMGLSVLPPDVNESFSQFTVISGNKDTPADSQFAHSTGSGQATRNSQLDSIRFGLSAVKGVGEGSVEQIIQERSEHGRFESIEDFARRVPLKILNKKLIESLAKSGAFDSFGERRTLVEHYDHITAYRKNAGDDGAQAGLFEESDAGLATATIEFPETPPATPQQKLQWEKETLGMYVSSHPLAGLKRYIGKKAKLIANLTTKDSGKKVTLAGIQEGIKKIRTKKGDTMAILFLEDPTGKIEVTLFPKAYAEAAGVIELPDTVLVVGGTLDYRGGQLQLRADAIKKSSLSTMIERAKADGIFDEEEAKRGLSVTRRSLEEDADAVDLLDEEGNVIAGEKVKLVTAEGESDLLGPLAKWIVEGMNMEAALKKLEGGGAVASDSSVETEPEIAPHPADASAVHTIELPPRAPKQLLLDLKRTLETFPGTERIQLKIGEQSIPLPLTVTMSPTLERRVKEVLAGYTQQAV